jgi:hypothetical protein
MKSQTEMLKSLSVVGLLRQTRGVALRMLAATSGFAKLSLLPFAIYHHGFYEVGKETKANDMSKNKAKTIEEFDRRRRNCFFETAEAMTVSRILPDQG